MRKPSIQGRIASVVEIAAADARVMYEIFARHYDCVSLEQFLLDLSEKDCVLVLRDANQGICGFSTQKVFRVSVGGTPVRAVFSGDTIVDRAYWGEQELGRCQSIIAERAREVMTRFVARPVQTGKPAVARPEFNLYQPALCTS